MCPKCPAYQITFKSGMSQCLQCAQQSLAADDRTWCPCFTGLYDNPDLRKSNATMADVVCVSCPRGSDCEKPGVTKANIQVGIEPCRDRLTPLFSAQALPGYWRANTSDLRYYRCRVQSYCLGGQPVLGRVMVIVQTLTLCCAAGVNSDCYGNRDGPLCAVCKPGYQESADRLCTKCSGSGSVNYALFVFLVAFPKPLRGPCAVPRARMDADHVLSALC